MQENIFISLTTKQELISEILSGIEKLLIKKDQSDLLKKEWLTTKETITLLKISPVTLWNYDQQGITKPQKVGSRKRYLKKDIVALLQAKESKKR